MGYFFFFLLLVIIFVASKRENDAMIRVLDKIEDYKKEIIYPNSLDNMELTVKQYMQFIELNQYLEDAKKAEFKNNPKKALSLYQDALYLLSSNTTYPELKNRYFNEVQEKVNSLSRSLK